MDKTRLLNELSNPSHQPCQIQRLTSYASEILLDHLIDHYTNDRDSARASSLYAQCLKAEGQKAESESELLRSLEKYSSVRPAFPETKESLSEEDIAGLIRYVYL